MTKLLAKRPCLLVALLSVPVDCTYSTDIENYLQSTHPYSSYKEFANSVCLPCHYKSIPNGTDLQKRFPGMSEQQTGRLLQTILKDGNMPPDPVYRKMLYIKFLQIKSAM